MDKQYNLVEFESIDNLTLIANNLKHILFELDHQDTSYFRITREAHQLLLRSMVEALRGTANFAVVKKGKRDKRKLDSNKGKNREAQTKEKQYWYQIGNEPSYYIYKIKISNCKIAWRFSDPIQQEFPHVNKDNFEDNYNEELKNFFDLLAMVQTEGFMNRYYMSKWRQLSDEEMKKMEWLHMDIRNEYEHFIPKILTAEVYQLIDVSVIAIRVSQELLLDSGNVPRYDMPEQIPDQFIDILDRLCANQIKLNPVSARNDTL